MRHKWSIEEETLLKQNYETASPQELMAMFGLSWNKIKDKAKKLDVNRQRCKYDLEALLQDYKSKMPLANIWKKYDMSNPTLKDILIKNNIQRRNHNLDEIDIDIFKDDYTNLTVPELVEKYKVCRPTIREKARELKLVRPAVFLHKQCKLTHKAEEICKEYTEQNQSIQQLADKYDVSGGTIFQLLHKNNITMRQGPYGATEQEIKEWLQQTTGKEFNSNHTILDRKEIDIYNDELKFGVEYCGLYWHCEYHKPNSKNYHYDKFIKCQQAGVQLITIFEDEWKNRKVQVKGALKSILGKNTRKLYARKCTIKDITTEQAGEFYNQYHIQGKSKQSLYCAGLYIADELLGVMSFGRHHRDSTQYTLDRLCFKDDVSIAGGASRLFKFLVNKSGVVQLVSWSDNRWFKGQVYSALGFVKDADMPADYSYVPINKPACRLSKQSQKKDNTNCPEGLTEKEWSIKQGLYRIWDCGKIRWKWNKVF